MTIAAFNALCSRIPWCEPAILEICEHHQFC